MTMNKECHFDPTTHTYTIGGVKVPSVSEILQPLNNYQAVGFDCMDAARKFGTNVHRTIELYLSNNLDFDSLDPHLSEVVDQFESWQQEQTEYNFANTVIEKPMFEKMLKYGGTPDIVIPGEAIIDIKTRKIDPCKDMLQLAAYEAFYGRPGSHRLIVLELYEDRYKEVDLSNHGRKQAWPMFRVMLDRWHREAEFAAKIKGWRGYGYN